MVRDSTLFGFFGKSLGCRFFGDDSILFSERKTVRPSFEFCYAEKFERGFRK